MSQFFIDTSIAPPPIPPTVPTQFTADDATIAVPAANNLNLFTNDSTSNNNNGIQSTASGSTVFTQLTNRLQGIGTTVGATTVDLVTFPLGAVPGTYNIEAKVVGFNSSTPASTGYTVIGTIRTSGAAGALDGVPDETPIENIALLTSDVDFIISGNNFIIRATGVAGLTLNWNVVATFVFIG